MTLCLIWSEEHRRWWRPGWRGYTDQIAEAGRYTEEVAATIVRDANAQGQFHEIAIPVPADLDACLAFALKHQGDDDAPAQ